jgi:predicted RNA-binding protein YlqC (UPF0109 family)
MQPFIEYLVKNLVDTPECVEIRCTQTESRVFIEVRVAPTDVGKVIGRKGVIINAIRVIAETVCARFGCKVNVELME